MSSNSQETIVDIVADIRAQNQGLPENGYFVAQYWDTVIFMANGKAYNIAEVIADGVNRLVESEAPSF